MSAGAPWSVKGIDPKAREIAKDIARREGLTLGDWLNRVIEDSAERDEPPPSRSRKPAAGARPEAQAKAPAVAGEELRRLKQALDRIDSRVEAAEERSSAAISGIDQTVLSVLERLESAEREQIAVAARFEGALQEIKSDQTRSDRRLAKAEEAAAQGKSIEALRALEAALGKVASHLYESETRTRESLEEMRSELGGLTERVGRMDESDLGPSQVMIDGVVQRIVQRLEEAEERTSTAIRGLETSVGEIDQRLTRAEAKSEAPEQRMELLAQDLTRNFQAARSELAEQVEAAAESRFAAMERSLRELGGQMSASEQRSTGAMERMGREVLRVAEALGKRMESVETRSAQAVELVGGEVSRIADVMEGRLRKADQVQAESLERLGAEIARITERLAERVGAAERRSAQAIDDVGEQVSRITEKFNERHERSSTDLAERIRQSEERTARLLEEAREKLDQRVAAAERRLVEHAVQAPPPSLPALIEPESMFAESDLPPGPFGAEDDLQTGLRRPEERASFAPRSFAPAAFSATPEVRRGDAPVGHVPPIESLPAEIERSPFEGDDFDVASMFESFNNELDASGEEHAAMDLSGSLSGDPSGVEALEEDFEVAEFAAEEHAEPEAEPMFEAEATPAAKLSTRELIEQARAAARASAQEGGGETAAQKRSLFSGFGIGAKKDKKPISRLKSAMMMSGLMAVLGIGTAGVTLYSFQAVPHEESGAKAPKVAAATAPGGAQTGLATPQAAVALASPAAPAVSGVDLPGLFSDSVRRIEAHDSRGMTDLKRAAGLGYAPAQAYLGQLYEEGRAGLGKDAAEGRRWIQRAAENGERGAMHNLALLYYQGIGGPKNPTTAAEWFRRAAQLGLVDSQFNLAELYEAGFGVGENPAEAYKWYLIASRSGDGESRSAAQRLKARLSPQALEMADRAAQAFRPEVPAVPAAAAALAKPPRG
jgi:localization factor PodJL